MNSYKATVGADFMEKEVVVDGKVINLEVLIPLSRSGIPPVRRNSGVWEAHFTGALIAASSSMTSQTKRYLLFYLVLRQHRVLDLGVPDAGLAQGAREVPLHPGGQQDRQGVREVGRIRSRQLVPAEAPQDRAPEDQRQE